MDQQRYEAGTLTLEKLEEYQAEMLQINCDNNAAWKDTLILFCASDRISDVINRRVKVMTAKVQKITTRKAQALATKEKIYTAAISLFEERGYENTAIEDITNKANTAKGTFYLYYSSKKDLVYHTIKIYDNIAKISYEKVSELQTFEDQLISYSEYLYKDIRDMGVEILKALYWNNLIDEGSNVTTPRRTIYNYITKIVELGLKTGELNTEKDAQFYIERIVVMYLGVDYYWCASSQNIDVINLAMMQTKSLVEGLLNT